jgi:molybdopterin synthase sulfur carrier subunit
MPVILRIPTPLLSLTNGQREVEAEGRNILELIEDLERRYPGLKERLCDEQGNLRRFINFFVNDEDIRFFRERKDLS